MSPMDELDQKLNATFDGKEMRLHTYAPEN